MSNHLKRGEKAVLTPSGFACVLWRSLDENGVFLLLGAPAEVLNHWSEHNAGSGAHAAGLWEVGAKGWEDFVLDV